MAWVESSAFLFSGVLGWFIVHLYQSVLLRDIPRLTEQSRQCLLLLMKYLSLFLGICGAISRAPEGLFQPVPTEYIITFISIF